MQEERQQDLKDLTFSVRWTDEDECWIVTSPDLPGMSAFGGTPEKAMKEAKIASKLFIEQ